LFVQRTGAGIGIPEQQSDASQYFSSTQNEYAGRPEDSLFARVMDRTSRQDEIPKDISMEAVKRKDDSPTRDSEYQNNMDNAEKAGRKAEEAGNVLKSVEQAAKTGDNEKSGKDSKIRLTDPASKKAESKNSEKETAEAAVKKHGQAEQRVKNEHIFSQVHGLPAALKNGENQAGIEDSDGTGKKIIKKRATGRNEREAAGLKNQAELSAQNEAAAKLQEQEQRNPELATLSKELQSTMAADEHQKSENSVEEVFSAEKSTAGLLRNAEVLRREQGLKQDGSDEGKVRHLVVDLRKSLKAAKNSGTENSGADARGSADQESALASRPGGFQNALEIKAADNFTKMSHAKQTEVLTSQLRQEMNQDIVKQTRFIINNNNKGEIRLVLKPEHLGNVRIKINLEDNHIAGRILVENNIVKEAFEQNMRHLQEAFKQSGFESAAMDVSVEERNAGHNGEGKGQKQKQLVNVHSTPAARAAGFEILSSSSLIDLTA
jgi:flagellar protein FlbC